jgi:hypothetical protein
MAETFINKAVALGNTADVSVYSPGAGETAIIIHAQVANVDGTNTADLYMDLYDTSATTASALVHELAVPADAAINPIGGKLVLEASDELRAWAGAASDLELTLGILVIT